MAMMRKIGGVEEYLAALPDEAHATLEKVRRAIRAAAPDAADKVAYGMPAFYQGKRPLVYYAAFKGHCSFYPASMAVMREFANELRRFETTKGTIRFPIGKPPPATLVMRVVKARIRENEARRAR
jgi:uncharacterized protein YdhG (YjbR/CyaY superfamily)